MAKSKAPIDRRTQAERTEATIGRLTTAARDMFAAQGFAAVSLSDVASAAGVTRGALYHHFDSKTALFRAVFEAQERALTDKVAAIAAQHSEAWEAVRAGCCAFLDICLDPAIQQIVLIDAPAVIGWEAMREIEARYVLALLEQGLQHAMAEGRLKVRPVSPLSSFLLGALAEMAMTAARSADPGSATEAAKAELMEWLDAIGETTAGATVLSSGPAVARPNFSGRWRVNLDRSRLRIPPPAEILMVIDHRDPVFVQGTKTTDLTGGVREGRFEGTTDGHTFTAQISGTAVTATADWEGSELVIRSQLKLGETTIELADTWSLSADGDTLAMEHRSGALEGQVTILERD